MRHVDRGSEPAPKALTAPVKGLSELQRAETFYTAAKPKGSFPFKVYKAEAVKTRLEHLFFGKCAYCETVYASSAPVDIEHYRPKGRIDGELAHPGYWWLAMDWENLLPSCIDCNRRRKQATPGAPSGSLVSLDAHARKFTKSGVILTGKKDLFPIAGTRALTKASNIGLESPLLLDPCRDHPEQHLIFHVDPANLIGLVLPRPIQSTSAPPAVLPALNAAPATVNAAAVADGVSRKGAVSIQIYGLNRLGLVQERTRILRRLQFLESTVIELNGIMSSLAGEPSDTVKAAVARLQSVNDGLLDEMKAMAKPDAPYSAMVLAWIEGFKARLRSPP